MSTTLPHDLLNVDYEDNGLFNYAPMLIGKFASHSHMRFLVMVILFRVLRPLVIRTDDPARQLQGNEAQQIDRNEERR